MELLDHRWVHPDPDGADGTALSNPPPGEALTANVAAPPEGIGATAADTRRARHNALGFVKRMAKQGSTQWDRCKAHLDRETQKKRMHPPANPRELPGKK
eukprot:TRINITY_DN94432_c0_g1_i1.p2 TRINITY_DN94432_c0_g1~~TRINITY_DN94432_c0_g1_i1.p2  ORF type:complete len:100 (-),score=14.23 TRINITY_DN94432_c0_g1_i1:68-367(-)